MPHWSDSLASCCFNSQGLPTCRCKRIQIKSIAPYETIVKGHSVSSFWIIHFTWQCTTNCKSTRFVISYLRNDNLSSSIGVCSAYVHDKNQSISDWNSNYSTVGTVLTDLWWWKDGLKISTAPVIIPFADDDERKSRLFPADTPNACIMHYCIN